MQQAAFRLIHRAGQFLGAALGPDLRKLVLQAIISTERPVGGSLILSNGRIQRAEMWAPPTRQSPSVIAGQTYQDQDGLDNSTAF